MRGDLIHSFCTEPAHAEPRGTDQLSVHDGRWAFCPGGVIGNDHKWEPTGGIALHEIGSFARARGVLSIAPPPSAAERSTRIHAGK